MEAVLLDTDVFSYLLRAGDKRGESYRRHVQGRTVAVSFVTVGELYFGAIKKGWSAKTLDGLEERLRAVVIVPYDIEVCRIYGTLRAGLMTPEGTARSIGANDLLDRFLRHQARASADYKQSQALRRDTRSSSDLGSARPPLSITTRMKERHPITAGNVALRGGETFFLIAGPCVIESEEHVLKMARFVQDVARRALRAGRRDG